jgi:hypothetical protein
VQVESVALLGGARERHVDDEFHFVRKLWHTAIIARCGPPGPPIRKMPDESR